MTRGKYFGLFLIVAFSFGCGNSHEETEEEKVDRLVKERLDKKAAFDRTDPYDIILTTFEGGPIKSEVQPMLESVMATYKYEITRENIIKVANMLLELRQASKVGVTEMDILKHIYQKGSVNDLSVQAAISATFLEKTK